MKKLLLITAVALGFVLGDEAGAATEWNTSEYDLYAGDFDGDNKDDVLYVAKDASKASGIARSDGSAPNIPHQSWPSNHLGIPWYANVYNVIVADFNGDAKDDLFLQRATPGDSFLLFADANGKITAINQTVANSALGLEWSADQHKIVAGDFSGDGRADLFLQATSPTGTHAVIVADANGQITSGPHQYWTDSSWSAFRWSARNSNVLAGDFNGDGKYDLLLQAKPDIVMVDYDDIPIPVPTYQPNTNGIVYSLGEYMLFQQSGVQQWSRNAYCVDWSPSTTNIVVGDFDDNGRADVLLQARYSSSSSYLVSGNATGAAFADGTPLATNVAWAAGSYRLIAGNFDGTGGAGIYYQAVTSSGTNYYANVVTGSAVSQSTHNPAAATGVVPATTVGHTVGEFSVGDGGTAAYAVPVMVPPGVGGIQPTLSLNYASGGGNGLLGVGWGLGGFSEITRCGKTLAQDNATDAVQLSLNDSFCLDGNKLRLTGGTYGVAGSTYQTEMETFSQVTAFGAAGNGPAYFTVRTKEGLTYQYGATADSRIESLNPAASTTARAWALSKVSDRVGNYMTITYEEDGAPNGSYRPAAITYTANDAAALAAAYRVNLLWDLRPAAEKLMANIAGGEVRETKRLNRIETQYNEPGTGWRLVRKYQLSYNESGVSGRSRLAAIQECDRDGMCLSPTSIGWQDGTTGWASTQVGSITLPESGGDGMSLDMNGDGRADYVYYDSAANYWKVLFANSDGTFQSPAANVFAASSTESPRAVPMDVNGDGRGDLLVSNAADGKWWWVRHTSGTSFVSTATGLSYASPGTHGAYVADVNGDGLEDLVSASSGTMYVALNSSNATVPIFSPHMSAWSTPPQTTFYTSAFGLFGGRYASEIVPTDFDGDGKEEILALTKEDLCGGEPGCPSTFVYHWQVLQWNGSALVDQTVLYSSIKNVWTRPHVADLNADGITDLVYGQWLPDSSAKTWRYRLGLGAEVNTGITVYGQSAISDCDSDGHADLVAMTSTAEYQCLKSDGAGLSATPVLLGSAGGSKVSDVNGDGLLDFIAVESNVMKVRLHRGVVADFVSSIADGYGNTISVTYAPLTDASVYTKGSGAVFPEMDVQAPIYVVKQFSASDGTGGSYTVSRSYTGARAHARGRGFLGFATTTSMDGRTGVTSISTYRQDFPYAGFLSETSVYQSSAGPLISRTVNTPAELPVQGAQYNDRHFPYVSASEQTNYEVGGAGNGLPIAKVTTSTQLDSYGNPTTTTSTTTDLTGGAQSYQTVAVNTYAAADPGNSCVDFVTSHQVTNTIPGLPAQTRTVQYVKDAANPAACRVYQAIVEPSDAAGKVTTTFGYDAFGHVNSEVVSAANVESRTATTSYGAQGVFPVSVAQSVSSTVDHTASKTYDYALGVPRTATDLNGLVASFDYDGFGRLVQESRPDGTKTAFVYSACTVTNGYCGDDRLRYQVEKRELDANGGVIRTSRQLFDSYGRALYTQAQTSSGAFSNVATNYDAQGRVYQQSQPYFSGFSTYFTTFSYDLVGRPTKEERRISEADSGTQTSQYAYDRLTHTFTDANGKVTTKYFNAIGQVVKMTDAANGITQYEYDQFGNLTKTIDPANNQIVNTFDIRGFKLSTKDPDMGEWAYTYYPTGELWTQTDAKNQVVTFTYDHLSRPKTRVEPEGTTTYVYGTSPAARSIGRLESVTSPGAFSQSFTYDSLGRLQDATTNADASSFVVSSAYNATTGFLETVTYPTSTTAVSGSRFKVKYEYEYGLLKRARDFHTSSTIYWEQVATNATGQTVDEVYGNGPHTYSTYDGVTGVLGERTVGATSQVQNLTYQWDKVGNLTQRRDLNLGMKEDFSYDNLYRLYQSKLNDVVNLDVGYNAIGNITSKTGIGTYTYPASGATSVRPHAVTSAGPVSFTYDGNGNMETRGADTVSWYSYNLPNRINKGSNYAQFYYGADRSRYKQVAYTAPGGVLPAGTETTLYVGGLFEKVTKPSRVVEYKHYILAGGDPIAIRTLRTNGANDTRYLHKDHLGSVDVITDESGGVVERLSYDAFGKRRDATTWSGSPGSSVWTNIAALTHRGFTFHEMLDNVDLIHMNGRVYDPSIGRFMSADPFVQAPLMSQSLNRYSYVMNNPLSLVDPSGYSWLSKAWKKTKRFLKKYIKPIIAVAVAVVATIYLGPAGTGFWAAVAKGAIAGAAYGATITALNGGNLRDIARAALTGAIAGGIAAGIGYGFGQLIASGQSPVDFGFESLDAGVGDSVGVNVEVTGIDPSILRGASAARDVVPSSRERGFGLRTSETTRAGSRYLINEEPAGLADLRRKHPALVALENDLWSQSLTSGFGKLLQQFGYSGGAQEHMVFVFQSAKGSGPLRFDVRAAQGAANRIEGTFTIPQGFELIAVFHTHPFPFVSGPGGYQRGPSDGLQELDDFDMARSYPNAFHYIRALGHRRNPALEEWYYYGSKAVAP